MVCGMQKLSSAVESPLWGSSAPFGLQKAGYSGDDADDAVMYQVCASEFPTTKQTRFWAVSLISLSEARAKPDFLEKNWKLRE